MAPSMIQIFGNYAYRLAVMAMLVWAAMAVVVVGLHDIPTLEILSISLAMACAFTCLDLTYRQSWSRVQWSWRMAAVGAFAVSGSSALYITAFKLAPPVHVELLMYIWPMVVLCANRWFFQEPITRRILLSVALSVLALIALHSDSTQWSVGAHYYQGYVCVLLAAITWSLYNVYTKHEKSLPAEMMGLYCGVGWCVIFPLHGILEPSVVPSSREWVCLIILGVGSQWFAYQAWDYAIKRQSAAKMATIAYATPIISVMLLTIWGYGAWSVSLTVACILMIISHRLVPTSQPE
jgi:drug/metabolite transporter (DMT)-like permease